MFKQVWHVAATPPNDKFQFTYFAHKLNSFETAPKKLLASDSRLRPDRWALEKGDLSKAGTAKSRSLSLSLSYMYVDMLVNTGMLSVENNKQSNHNPIGQ